MKIAIIKIAIFLVLSFSGDQGLKIFNENSLGFTINKQSIFGEDIQMFCALLAKDKSPVRCDFNGDINFHNQVLPMDIYNYYENRGDEEYYTLLTKTTYGLPQDISFFTSERLSNEHYLKEVMPNNKIQKVDDYYELEVGFGAPDITFTLDFFSNKELSEQFPDLVGYFKKHDFMDQEPAITVFQHNHKFSKILGQKTTKMSISITRYFDEGKDETLVINYTLNFIYNLPPAIFGGGDLLVSQMKEGVIALVRDTRAACQSISEL